MKDIISNITVIEHPISDFEHIELDAEGQAIKHRPTPDEYKAKLPDYQAGPVKTVSAGGLKHLRWNTDLERLEYDDGTAVSGSLFQEGA